MTQTSTTTIATPRWPPTMPSCSSVPFRGTKRSGHGRELAAGIREFTTVRTYWVTNHAGSRVEPDTRAE